MCFSFLYYLLSLMISGVYFYVNAESRRKCDCLEWLHTKKCTVKESTYIKYSTAVNKHIIPKLGVCRPLGFTTELMDDFIKELQFEDELASKTVHDILVVLHGVLKFASSKFAGA